MLALYTLTILVSAALLFIVQPMFARMVLPSLGGTPAVWNTALVFYQTALLGGYAYVHWTSTHLQRRTQVALHAALLLAAGCLLPLHVPSWWNPPTDRNPIPALLGLLTVAVGLPFFVVSTTGPLLQKWFAGSRHRLARDPYFLYAASNVGSIAGLLSYPILIEPTLRLGHQTLGWSVGYAALVLLTLTCGFWTSRGLAAVKLGIMPDPLEPEATEEELPPPAPAPAIERRRRLRWILLAFAPSSLMMGVTTHISTDIAAVPLLWVLPLALYLASFVIVFARRQILPLHVATRVLPFLVLPLLVVMVGRTVQPLFFVIGLHLAVLLIAAVVCHGALAQDRPGPERLTEFYLWMAVGGALGGFFNALVAPIAFDAILEYPIAIALVCLLIPTTTRPGTSRRSRILDFALPAAVGLLVAGVTLGLESTDVQATRPIVVLLVALLTLPIFSFQRRPLRFGLAVAAVLLLNPVEIDQRVHGLHSERSFFGLHRVLTDYQAKFHVLCNGSTVHGVQRVRPVPSREPLGYYNPSGPLGDVFRAVDGLGHTHAVGILGLGAGGIAAYALPGQRWTYYEIDPAVNRIAHDPRMFTYLSGSPAPIHVVLGDGRLSLAKSRETYDMIVLDAYSSDAIPVHLLTRESLQLYLQHLSPDGLIVFHLSNQYFRLAPVVGALARDAGLTCRVRYSGDVSDSAAANGIMPSVYAVAARAPSALGSLLSAPGWKPVKLEPKARLWTDDYSSLWAALHR